MTEIEFQKHEVTSPDEFSEWVDPKQDSYLMACCGCGLVHELQFRVAKFTTDDGDECEVQHDPNLHAQFRAKRRDDIGVKP